MLKSLSDTKKLFIVKLIHTIIWGLFVSAIIYVCYAGLFDRMTKWVWFCIAAVLIEAIVLLTNKWRCPFTSIAGKYTNVQPIGFDIFIPKWLAQHNKILFSTLFVFGLVLVLWRTL